MLNTRDDYFSLSLQQALPNRCPLVGRCERRAHTIALANDWNLKDAPEQLDMKGPLVTSVGEPAHLIGGQNNFIIGGMCPEVGLFESSMAIIGLSGAPVTKGQYDKYMTPQYQILETGHFSQCAEYVQSGGGAALSVTEAISSAPGIAPPEKVTLKWLFEHVPVSIWFGAATLLFAAFVTGIQASRFEIVRDILRNQPANERGGPLSGERNAGVRDQ